MQISPTARVGAVALIAIGAIFGLVLGASAANAPTAPGQTQCGDMAGPVWRALPVGERTGAMGSHYTVTAINMPCTKARALTAQLIRLKAPSRGFDRKILAGYTCLNTNAPTGSLFFIGGCVAGTAVMPVPGASGFNWHHCQFVLASGKHPTCTWKRYTT